MNIPDEEARARAFEAWLDEARGNALGPLEGFIAGAEWAQKEALREAAQSPTETSDRDALADIVHAWLCRDPRMESPATLADDILASYLVMRRES